MQSAPVARHVSGEFGDDHDVSILPVGASVTVDAFLVQTAVSAVTLIITFTILSTCKYSRPHTLEEVAHLNLCHSDEKRAALPSDRCLMRVAAFAHRRPRAHRPFEL